MRQHEIPMRPIPRPQPARTWHELPSPCTVVSASTSPTTRKQSGHRRHDGDSNNRTCGNTKDAMRPYSSSDSTRTNKQTTPMTNQEKKKKKLKKKKKQRQLPRMYDSSEPSGFRDVQRTTTTAAKHTLRASAAATTPPHVQPPPVHSTPAVAAPVAAAKRKRVVVVEPGSRHRPRGDRHNYDDNIDAGNRNHDQKQQRQQWQPLSRAAAAASRGQYSTAAVQVAHRREMPFRRDASTTITNNSGPTRHVQPQSVVGLYDFGDIDIGDVD